MSKTLKALTDAEIEQVNGAASLFSIESATVRNLTVASSPVDSRIGNIAICSSCHGCTKIEFNPGKEVINPAQY